MNQIEKKIREWVSKEFTPNYYSYWSNPINFTSESRLTPKGLRILEAPPGKGFKYNCYVFAFGFKDDSDFNRSDSSRLLLSNGNEVQKLINSLLQKVDTPKSDDYIIYRNEDRQITHAGIVKSRDLIISKWSDGPLMEHPILGVNPDYGTDISFYKKNNTKEIKEFLINNC